MNSQLPIGIFDSGVGGLSVWSQIAKLLPFESIIYLADSANCPYGSKSKEEIIRLSVKNTELLLSKKCKIIIVACNTATAASIDYLRKNYKVPFVGMEPAVKPAALNSLTRNVGILATEGTFNGRLFKETSSKYAKYINFHIQIGNGLVELVEAGNIDTPEADILLRKYIQPFIDANVDQIVLGCTHYPFLSDAIRKITNDKMQIVEPSEAVARRTKDQLIINEILSLNDKTPNYQFYTTGNETVIKKMVSKLIGNSANIFKV